MGNRQACLPQFSFPLSHGKTSFTAEEQCSLHQSSMQLKRKLHSHASALDPLALSFSLRAGYTCTQWQSFPHCHINEFTKKQKQNHTGEHPLSFLSKLGAKQGVQRRTLSLRAWPIKGGPPTPTSLSASLAWQKQSWVLPRSPSPSLSLPSSKGEVRAEFLPLLTPHQALLPTKKGAKLDSPKTLGQICFLGSQSEDRRPECSLTSYFRWEKQ